MPYSRSDHLKGGKPRLQSNGRNPIDYMLGAYYSHGRLALDVDFGYYFAQFGPVAGLPANTPVAAQGANLQTDESRSIFGAVTLKLVPKLRVNVGLRYSVVEKEASRTAAIGTAGAFPRPSNFQPFTSDQQVALARSLGVPLNPYADPQRTDRKLMPNASVQFDLSDDVMAYASYSRGFKAGGFGMAFNADSFDPETVDAYELGLKGSVLDRRVIFSLAAYYQKYNDLQEAISTVVGNAVISSVANAAKSVSKGLEFSTTVKLTPSLLVSADIAYLVARYSEYTNGTCTVLQSLTPPCVQELSGRRRAFAPEFSGNVSAQYVQPLNDELVVKIAPSVYFTSSYYQLSTIDPLSLQQGFAKVDLRVALGREDGSWEVAVLGKNITDMQTASFRNGLPGSPGSLFALSDRPRSVAVQVSYRY